MTPRHSDPTTIIGLGPAKVRYSKEYLSKPSKDIALMLGVAVMVFFAFFWPVKAHSVEEWQLKETRYGPAPQRYANNEIKRSKAVAMAFARIHPCPSNGLPDTGCPYWQIQHIAPLACGGVDAVFNMWWVPDVIKTCSDPWCLDRHERQMGALNPPVPDTANCVNSFPVSLEPEQ